MKNIKKLFVPQKIITILFCIILLASTTVAFAGSTTTLLTYEGFGIRSKKSAQNFELNGETKITVNHDQTVNAAYLPRESYCSMTVSLQKKGVLVYSDTGDEFTLYGSDATVRTWTKAKGTYRLWFSSIPLSDETWPAYDIKGQVTKPA